MASLVDGEEAELLSAWAGAVLRSGAAFSSGRLDARGWNRIQSLTLASLKTKYNTGTYQKVDAP